MALNIKNPKVEKMISEISELTGETKTETIRKALEDRRSQLKYRGIDADRPTRFRRFLQQEVWPHVPAAELGRRLSRRKEEAILGYGKNGV